MGSPLSSKATEGRLRLTPRAAAETATSLEEKEARATGSLVAISAADDGGDDTPTERVAVRATAGEDERATHAAPKTTARRPVPFMGREGGVKAK